mgnify:CR=1 FL=1
MSTAIIRQTTSVFNMSCLKYVLNSVTFECCCGETIGVFEGLINDGRLYRIPVPLIDGVGLETTPLARRCVARSFCFRVLLGIEVSLAYS